MILVVTLALAFMLGVGISMVIWGRALLEHRDGEAAARHEAVRAITEQAQKMEQTNGRLQGELELIRRGGDRRARS